MSQVLLFSSWWYTGSRAKSNYAKVQETFKYGEKNPKQKNPNLKPIEK